MTYGQLTVLAETAVKAALEISSASEDAPAIRAVYQSVMDAGKPFIRPVEAVEQRIEELELQRQADEINATMDFYESIGGSPF